MQSASYNAKLDTLRKETQVNNSSSRVKWTFSSLLINYYYEEWRYIVENEKDKRLDFENKYDSVKGLKILYSYCFVSEWM